MQRRGYLGLREPDISDGIGFSGLHGYEQENDGAKEDWAHARRDLGPVTDDR